MLSGNMIYTKKKDKLKYLFEAVGIYLLIMTPISSTTTFNDEIKINNAILKRFKTVKVTFKTDTQDNIRIKEHIDVFIFGTRVKILS